LKDQYQIKRKPFPIYLTALAIIYKGLSTFFNGHLVLRFGMRKKLAFNIALFFYVAFLKVCAIISGKQDANPARLLIFDGCFFNLTFFLLGLLLEGIAFYCRWNLLGHIAGIRCLLKQGALFGP